MIQTPLLAQLDIPEGQDATFTVSASGVMLIYEWFKDGVSISDIAGTYSGTTSETLTVESAEVSDEGEYTVDVMNTAGTAQDGPVILSICKSNNTIIIVYTCTCSFKYAAIHVSQL